MIKILQLIKINKIKIPEDFKKSPPRQDKYEERRKMLKNKTILPFVVLDRNKELTDGYIWYLLHQEYDIGKIHFIYKDEDIFKFREGIPKVNNSKRLEEFCDEYNFGFDNLGYALKITKSKNEIFYIYIEDIKYSNTNTDYKLELFHESYNNGTLKNKTNAVHTQGLFVFNKLLLHILNHNSIEDRICQYG